MTADDARNYFFQNLPLVKNSSDLLRLTFWVLPYLPAKPTRPLGRIETMVFQLKLEKAADTEKFDVWFHSNRDVSTQLETLAPIYSHVGSGPAFCSGLSTRLTMPGGPNFSGTGLPLGPFATEHAAAKTKLDAVQSVESWWDTFLGQTTLWMRTAYNWHTPTKKQEEILEKAKNAMLVHAPVMAENTRARYDHESGRVQLYFSAPRFDDSKINSKCNAYLFAPHWNALVAGQKFLRIKDTDSNILDIGGMDATMPGVQTDIKNVCQVICELRGWEDMGDIQVTLAMLNAKHQHERMSRELPVDSSCFEAPAPG